MKKQNTILLLWIFAILITTSLAPAQASKTEKRDLGVYTIEKKEIRDKKHSLKGEIPRFTNIKNETFAKRLNGIVNQFYNQTQKESAENSHKRRGGSISYELTGDKQFLSVILHGSVNSGNTQSENIKTIVLDKKSYKIYALTDILGSDAYKTANQSIKKQIRAQRDNYFKGKEGFQTTSADTNFYIDADSNLVVIFNKYEIAPGSSGTPRFIIEREELGELGIYTIEQKNVEDRALSLSGSIPIFTNITDQNFAQTLNGMIDDFYNKTVESIPGSTYVKAGEKILEGLSVDKKILSDVLSGLKPDQGKSGNSLTKHSATISYETMADDRFLSIILRSGVNQGNTQSENVKTIVLDKRNYKIYTLTDLLGANAYKTADRAITKQIAANPTNYFSGSEGFQGTGSATNFYVDARSRLTVIFSKYEIAPGASGTPTFVIQKLAKQM